MLLSVDARRTCAEVLPRPGHRYPSNPERFWSTLGRDPALRSQRGGLTGAVGYAEAMRFPRCRTKC
jgi:hypothetical protein